MVRSVPVVYTGRVLSAVVDGDAVSRDSLFGGIHRVTKIKRIRTDPPNS